MMPFTSASQPNIVMTTCQLSSQTLCSSTEVIPRISDEPVSEAECSVLYDQSFDVVQHLGADEEDQRDR